MSSNDQALEISRRAYNTATVLLHRDTDVRKSRTRIFLRTFGTGVCIVATVNILVFSLTGLSIGEAIFKTLLNLFFFTSTLYLLHAFVLPRIHPPVYLLDKRKRADVEHHLNSALWVMFTGTTWLAMDRSEESQRLLEQSITNSPVVLRARKPEETEYDQYAVSFDPQSLSFHAIKV